MSFFKPKTVTPKLVVPCEQCGTACSANGNCPNCESKTQKLSTPASPQNEHLGPVKNAGAATENENKTYPGSSDEWKRNDAFSESPRLTKPPVTPLLTAASFKRRLLANAIDHGFLLAVELVGGFLIGIPLMLFLAFSYRPAIVTNIFIDLLVAYAFAALWFLYFALFESSRLQATPGKMIAGLKTVGINAHRVGFGRAFAKSMLQLGILGALSAVLAILLGLILTLSIGSVSASIVPPWLLHMMLLAVVAPALLCVPFFHHRTQSFIDLVCGRMVITTQEFDSFDWQNATVVKTGVFEHMMKWLLAIPAVIGVIAGLVIGTMYFTDLIAGGAKAIPIAEQGFKIDPDGESPKSREFFNKAIRTYPHVAKSYALWIPVAGLINSDSLRKEASQKSMILLMTPASETAFGKEEEWHKHYDPALVHYRRAIKLAGGHFPAAAAGVSRVLSAQRSASK